MRKYIVIGVIVVMISLIGACSNEGNTEMKDKNQQTVATYECISQEEAHSLMEDGVDCIILDVRTWEEYNEKHILNAICIPNETIETEPPAELPDKDQLILVYCRSGNRSKQASEKLAAMGYTNIKEFGGINTWTGATVSHQD